MNKNVDVKVYAHARYFTVKVKEPQEGWFNKSNKDEIVEAVERVEGEEEEVPLEVVNWFNIGRIIEPDEIKQLTGVMPINKDNQPVEKNVLREGRDTINERI